MCCYGQRVSRENLFQGLFNSNSSALFGLRGYLCTLQGGLLNRYRSDGISLHGARYIHRTNLPSMLLGLNFFVGYRFLSFKF